MATPYVPVPIPIGSSASSFTASRNQRSSSLGSLSTSSNSSKGQLEDSNTGTRKQTSAPGQRDSASSVCSSPLLRTKFTNADSCIEYSTRPRESEEQNLETANLEDRPSTPTILGYEVMEERAKFTGPADPPHPKPPKVFSRGPRVAGSSNHLHKRLQLLLRRAQRREMSHTSHCIPMPKANMWPKRRAWVPSRRLSKERGFQEMKELNGFKAWPADSDQSLERYRSMLPNWFGLELKPAEKVFAIQGGVPSGGDSAGPGPSEGHAPPEIASLPASQATGKNHHTKTPAFKHLDPHQSSKSFLRWDLQD